MTQPLTRIFVYGSLLRGEPNHALLAGATFEREARTAPGFALVDLGPYPGMLREGDGDVAGEVWAVDAPTLAALERLEDVPHMYVRERIPLRDGDVVDAYLYVRETAGWPRVAGGSWRERA